jgi:hypothetical protein
MPSERSFSLWPSKTETRWTPTGRSATGQDLWSEQRAAAHSAFPSVDVWWEENPEFISTVSDRMTREDANRIRAMRSDGATWRYLAEWAYEHLRPGWRVGWVSPDTQHVGEDLCRIAASRLGEDPDRSPWN